MNPKKVAFITGITGQDGSYLAELLIQKGYIVHGLVRKSSHFNTGRIEHLFDTTLQIDSSNLFLHYGDIQDQARIIELLGIIRPHEIYNLAAQSHVKVSFEIPVNTSQTDGIGPLNLLEAIRILGIETKFYQASSSEMFGNEPAPQNEETIFSPRSPYAVAKLQGHHLVNIYRQSYGVFAVSGILFNHESPRRHESFVTRKITKGVAEIATGRRQYIELGNLDSKRDWGYAPEYVNAMWLMLQQEIPDDYVIATGTTNSVQDFLGFAFAEVGLDWNSHVRIDDSLKRPMEVDFLFGDFTKAHSLLDWSPKVFTQELARIMVSADLKKLGN